ncbi:hypothetical protein WOLCODRAFT_168144 [Wolfiporia cocos MD-104 SS10]|uniref:Uncharacterized protein n=1 Tax=Wolfiporia cocos (strain MD-104) TaxID=742152 RepID=A0A2H3JTY0_WOLCO|nr:hypothetical protein WOLCODRAFT_168144 [Wolfiporia cocos MD-104 SS10]
MDTLRDTGSLFSKSNPEGIKFPESAATSLVIRDYNVRRPIPGLGNVVPRLVGDSVQGVQVPEKVVVADRYPILIGHRSKASLFSRDAELSSVHIPVEQKTPSGDSKTTVDLSERDLAPQNAVQSTTRRTPSSDAIWAGECHRHDQALIVSEQRRLYRDVEEYLRSPSSTDSPCTPSLVGDIDSDSSSLCDSDQSVSEMSTDSVVDLAPSVSCHTRVSLVIEELKRRCETGDTGPLLSATVPDITLNGGEPALLYTDSPVPEFPDSFVGADNGEVEERLKHSDEATIAALSDLPNSSAVDFLQIPSMSWTAPKPDVDSESVVNISNVSGSAFVLCVPPRRGKFKIDKRYTDTLASGPADLGHGAGRGSGTGRPREYSLASRYDIPKTENAIKYSRVGRGRGIGLGIAPPGYF